jgi:hypothetical protein
MLPRVFHTVFVEPAFYLLFEVAAGNRIERAWLFRPCLGLLFELRDEVVLFARKSRFAKRKLSPLELSNGRPELLCPLSGYSRWIVELVSHARAQPTQCR